MLLAVLLLLAPSSCLSTLFYFLIDQVSRVVGGWVRQKAGDRRISWTDASHFLTSSLLLFSYPFIPSSSSPSFFFSSPFIPSPPPHQKPSSLHLLLMHLLFPPFLDRHGNKDQTCIGFVRSAHFFTFSIQLKNIHKIFLNSLSKYIRMF